METWITADTHYGHRKIIQLCNRCISVGGAKRQFSDVREMDDYLIEQHNSCVKPNDMVIHAGDFAFGDPTRYLKRLHGKIHLFLGNHDKFKEYGLTNAFASINYVRMMVVNDQKIWVSHYAHRTWPSAHRGAWHVFGHSHGSLADTGDCSLDVGVDTHDFRPWSFEELASEMAKRKYVQVDHHAQETEEV